MQRQRKLIIGNWKMHGSLAGNATWFAQFKAACGPALPVDAALCVSAPYLAQARDQLQHSALAWGGQDVSAHEASPCTGEVAASMLADLSCRYVIVGHSERRRQHGEDDALVVRKAQRALQAGLVPVACLGETLGERAAGETAQVLDRQLGALIDGLDAEDLSRIVLAYEPVWSIGTGHAATPEQAQQVHAHLRGQLGNSRAIRILYGGSMNAANASALLGMPDVDGGLIGGASIKVAEFLSILRSAALA